MSLLDSPCETANLDFKETLDLTNSRDRVELAKDVLAMANSGGGHIVVGVEDVTRQVGISEEAPAALRDAKTVNGSA
jgi:predicted HTH transcriptional regulator